MLGGRFVHRIFRFNVDGEHRATVVNQFAELAVRLGNRAHQDGVAVGLALDGHPQDRHVGSRRCFGEVEH